MCFVGIEIFYSHDGGGVLSLTLFDVTPRESVTSVSSFASLHANVANLYYDYDLRMLYLILFLWSPVSDVIFGLGVRASMVWCGV